MTEKQEKDEAARGEELVFYCKTEEGEKVRWAIESAFVEPPSFAETDGEGEGSQTPDLPLKPLLPQFSLSQLMKTPNVWLLRSLTFKSTLSSFSNTRH